MLEGKAGSQPNNVSKHRNELFSKETLTNSCTVCQSYYNYKYVENIKTRINFLDKRQIRELSFLAGPGGRGKC